MFKFFNEFQSYSWVTWVDSIPVATTRGTLIQGFGWMKFQDSPLPTFIIFKLYYFKNEMILIIFNELCILF